MKKKKRRERREGQGEDMGEDRESVSERKGEGGGRYEEREERWKQIKKGFHQKSTSWQHLIVDQVSQVHR